MTNPNGIGFQSSAIILCRFSQAELMTVGARIDKIHNSETPNPIKPDEEVISGMITEEDLGKTLMFGEDVGFEALVRIATMVGQKTCEELDDDNTKEKEKAKSQPSPDADDEHEKSKGIMERANLFLAVGELQSFPLEEIQSATLGAKKLQQTGDANKITME